MYSKLRQAGWHGRLFEQELASPAEEGGLWTELFVTLSRSMSSRRSRARSGTESEQPSLPPADPPPPENAERDDKGKQHHDDEPPRRDGGPESNARRETGRGTGEVGREVVTAAVLDALSNPDVICRLLAVVSPGGPSGSGSSMAASDGEWLSQCPY